jgi:ribulose-5-phosphate 4-epimerase/fuculose-1-phosphate aldolase
MSSDPIETEIRRAVVLGGRVLDAAGLSDLVWGHVSMRDPAGRGVWMKAAGLGFDEVTEDEVLLVGPDGQVIVGEGPRHAEYPIHTEILHARPDARSVVHVHPSHAIALAASGVDLQAFSHVGGIFAAGVRRYQDAAGLVDTPHAGAALARALGSDQTLLMVGHGVVTVGPSVALAVTAAIMLERACRLQLLAQAFGGVVDALPAAEALDIYRHTLAESHMLGAWAYLSRLVDRGGSTPYS